MKILGKIFSWFSATKFWFWLSSKYISKLNFRFFGYPQGPIEKWAEILSAINEHWTKNPGKFHAYAFVLTDVKSLAAMLIRLVEGGNVYTHAGIIYRGNFIHANTKGVNIGSILSVLKECDNFAIVAIQISDAIGYNEKVEDFIRAKDEYFYDYQMNLKNSPNLIYCSELTFDLIYPFALNPNFRVKSRYGREIFSPQDLYEAGEVIFEHRID